MCVVWTTQQPLAACKLQGRERYCVSDFGLLTTQRFAHTLINAHDKSAVAAPSSFINKSATGRRRVSRKIIV